MQALVADALREAARLVFKVPGERSVYEGVGAACAGALSAVGWAAGASDHPAATLRALGAVLCEAAAAVDGAEDSREDAMVALQRCYVVLPDGSTFTPLDGAIVVDAGRFGVRAFDLAEVLRAAARMHEQRQDVDEHEAAPARAAIAGGAA